MSGSSWYYGGYGDFQIERNVDFIEQLVKDNELDERGYFIYHAVGANDAVKSQSIDMADEMLSREIFTPDHYVFYQKDGGYHDFNAVEEYLYNALPVIFDKISQDGESDNVVRMEKEITQTGITEYYTRNTLMSEVQSDPAFGNYGRLIFPVDSGYMGGSTLGNLSLAWYNYIDPDKTVEICNYMKTQAENGNTFFYDIYTDEEKKADPEKADTVVMGSPLYWHNICGLMRNFLDRCYGPIGQGEFSGKKLYFIMQGASPEKWQLEACDFTMSRFAGLYGFEYMGMITDSKEAKNIRME